MIYHAKSATYNHWGYFGLTSGSTRPGERMRPDGITPVAGLVSLGVILKNERSFVKCIFDKFEKALKDKNEKYRYTWWVGARINS